MRQAVAIAVLTLTVSAGMAGQQPALRSGIDLTAFDRSTRPQDDFFQFVNGGWLARTTIPPDQSRFGTFDILREGVRERLRALLEDAARPDESRDADTRRVGDLYASFMNEAAANAAGVTPLTPMLQEIDAVRTPDDVARVLGRLSVLGVRTPFGAGVAPEPSRPTVYALTIRQGGLGMPNRDYYASTGAEYDRYRRSYVDYAARLLTLAGHANAAADAERVLAFETRLAGSHWTAAESRDQVKLYNPIAAADLAGRYPGANWRAWLNAIGAENPGDIVIGQVSAIAAAAAGVTAWPLEEWKLYLKVALLDEYAPFLSEPFVEAQFAFRGRTLSGQDEQSPRWRRGVTLVDAYLGESLGRVYVDRYFPPDARQRMTVLIENLRAAYKDAIEDAAWMSPATKREALAKLASFKANIGHPDTWRDYSAVTVGRDTLAANVMSAERAEHERQINRIGGEVDMAEWSMTPPTVNAQYNTRRNAIFFPAGILQPPFFDPESDDAVNYGAIGAVIGHEMGHGFDDQGRRSDALGQLRDWWTAEDAARYEERAARIADQFSAYEALPGLKVNGRLTLGENIGDLSGLTIALRAYRKSLAGRPAPVLDGFTGEQRFFIGWAQVWRGLRRDDSLRALVLSDPHSPEKFRTNGPLSNMDAFYEAFGVSDGDRMWVPPAARTTIW